MPNSNFAVWGGRAFIAAAFLIGFVSIFGYSRYVRFHHRIESLKASGELLAMEDLTYEVERPADDARLYLRQVFASAKEVNNALSEFEQEEGRTRTDEEAIELFDQLSVEYPDLFPTIALAASSPDMSYQFDFSSNDLNDNFRHIPVMRTMEWKCEVQLAKGDVDGAIDSAIELFRLGKLNSGRGILIDEMLGLALQRSAWLKLAEGSAEKSLPDEKLALVNSLIQEDNLMERYAQSLLFERSLCTYGMINFSELDQADYDFNRNPLAWLSTQFQFGPAMMVGNDYLDSMETAIRHTDFPLSKDVSADLDRDAYLLRAFDGDPVVAYERIRLSFGEAVAQSHALQILLALDAAPDAAQRKDWPVEYLIGIGVAEKATIDPFDDKPMRIKRENDRWVVYSCGKDRQDDGGVKSLDCGFFLAE